MEQRRLTRSNRNDVIGGVCAGLGEYFNVDPIIFRIIFVAFTLAGGAGLILYFILWLVIPDEDSYNYSQRVKNQQDTSNTSQVEEPRNNRNPAGEVTDEASKKQAGKNASAYIIGVCFIVLGAFFLFNNFFHISFSRLWPVLLIAAGVGMIISYLQKSKK